MGKLRLELIILTTNLIKTWAGHAAAVKVAELNSLNCYFRSLPARLHHEQGDGTVRRASGNYSGVPLWSRWWSDVCTLELLERYKPVLLRSTDNITPTMFGVSYDSLSLCSARVSTTTSLYSNSLEKNLMLRFLLCRRQFSMWKNRKHGGMKWNH